MFTIWNAALRNAKQRSTAQLGATNRRGMQFSSERAQLITTVHNTAQNWTAQKNAAQRNYVRRRSTKHGAALRSEDGRSASQRDTE